MALFPGATSKSGQAGFGEEGAVAVSSALGRAYAKLPTKARQASWPKVMAGPAGRVLSRTGTRWGRSGATSTHSLLPGGGRGSLRGQVRIARHFDDPHPGISAASGGGA